ncbi:flagellar hook-basal body protein [Sphingomonas sp. Leaf357]|uniref:flagellar hook protein FlgE n=1 Tax=Sphingomonas sp. Leaf357 TaxID=1736350 RepID=UPI0006F5A974|nr:flagellar hook protein FlgE [Sphingomonas sp. Leaf357]KQS03359.1 flagellar hook-basal body protein [Sphingomonas sp. Leaf357]
MSFYTSLSGLQAAQTEMSTISHNLANVGTDGFKKSRTDFADVIASNLQTDPRKLVGSGTVVKGNTQQFSEGSLKTTGSSLDLAISGDGFFAVKTNGLSSAINYTRNGSFHVDPTTHNVVDDQGSALQVYPVDGDGNVTATGSDGLTNLRLPETSGVPKATTGVSLGVNLQSTASVPTGTFDPLNASTYNNATTTTIYDSSGKAMTMTNYYTHVSDNTWSVRSYVGNQALTVGGSANPTTVTFDTNGNLTAPAGPIAYDSFLPTTGGAAQSVTVDLAGSTQKASAFAVAGRSQDGKAVGELSGVTVDKSGIVTASFSNGDTIPLGKVALANFTNPAGLRQNGNSYWSASGISGQALLGGANDNGYGSLNSGTIEGSNVDVTEELVNLIAAQRNFQANAKALDTANQISQTIFNIRS